MNYEQLTAPCGRDCFNCPGYLANENAEIRDMLAKRMNPAAEQIGCPGCRACDGDCQVLRHYGFDVHCKLYACAQDKNVQFCHECTDFPCGLLQPLADRADRFPHNLKLFNLCVIKKLGLTAWAETQASRHSIAIIKINWIPAFKK
ncbi:DUF3795 domain-containing protein [candidate division KSB1 bacterium]|nr:DUF3795 domain-containing protein [candidate division KSB1 bacterium]